MGNVIKIRVRKNFAETLDFLRLTGFDVAKSPRPRIRIVSNIPLQDGETDTAAHDLFYETMKRLLDRQGVAMIKNDSQLEVIDWLKDNESRGLLLMGNNGNGKSLIAMSVIPVILYMVYEKVAGIYHVRQLHDKWSDVRKRDIVVVDDIGCESKVNDFGTKRDYFMELVELCEEENRLLIATTNYTGEELREKYDDRTYSRLCGMCRVVIFEEDDYRIKNAAQ